MDVIVRIAGRDVGDDRAVRGASVRGGKSRAAPFELGPAASLGLLAGRVKWALIGLACSVRSDRVLR